MRAGKGFDKNNTKWLAWILAMILCGGSVLAGCSNEKGTEVSGSVKGTVVVEAGTEIYD